MFLINKDVIKLCKIQYILDSSTDETMLLINLHSIWIDEFTVFKILGVKLVLFGENILLSDIWIFMKVDIPFQSQQVIGFDCYNTTIYL